MQDRRNPNGGIAVFGREATITMRVLSFSIALVLIATNAVAEGLLVERPYVFSNKEFALVDTACITAFKEHIAPEFRGLRTLTIQSSNIFEATNGATALYPDVDFGGDYGDAKGAINCIFSLENNKVTDVAVSFWGTGLGGFEKRGFSSPSSDPADWKITSFSMQLT